MCAKGTTTQPFLEGTEADRANPCDMKTFTPKVLTLSLFFSFVPAAASTAAGPLDDVMTAICERTGTAFLDDHPCEEWVARYEGPLKGFDHPQGLEMSTDGTTLYLTGWSSTPTNWRDSGFVTLAYDTRSGQMLWRSEFHTPGSEEEGPSPFDPITLSPDGSRVYVTGFSAGAGMSQDFITIAYDAATGDELWLDRYDGPEGGMDRAFFVVASPDGERVYVTGDSAPPGSNDIDVATIAYDAGSGARLWRTGFGGPLDYLDTAHGQALSPDGTRLYTVSQSWNTCDVCGNGNADVDIAVTAYDTTDQGKQVWSRYYDDPEEIPEFPRALEVSPDGSTLYVGAMRWFGDCSTLAYEASTGHIRWETRKAGPSCMVNDLTVSPDGSGVYLATRAGTSAYDAATGVERWHRVEPGTSDYPRHQAVVVSPDSSKVMVVGSNAYDFWTIVYTAGSAEPLFRARLDMYNGDETPTLGAFSPDGALVYVSGRMTFLNADVNLSDNEDFLTVAYRLERPPFTSRDRRAA
jgi:DNA-binding beta-propeller fold protein YncE